MRQLYACAAASDECGGHAMGGWLEDPLLLVGQVGGIYGESGLVSQAGGGGGGGNAYQLCGSTAGWGGLGWREWQLAQRLLLLSGGPGMMF